MRELCEKRERSLEKVKSAVSGTVYIDSESSEKFCVSGSSEYNICADCRGILTYIYFF